MQASKRQPATINHEISLYVVRWFATSQERNLQAIFDSQHVFNFTEISKICKNKKSNHHAAVFRLTIPVQIDGNEISYILTDEAWHRFTNYALRVQASDMFSSRHCAETCRRSITNYTSRYEFIFDFQPPDDDSDFGKNVSIWDQLCFFTYFMVHQHQYELAPAFMDQFAIFLQAFSIEISENIFTNLIDTTYNYRHYIQDKLQEPSCSIIVLQMFGIVDIDINSIVTDEPTTRVLVEYMLHHILPNLSTVLEKTTDREWLLLKDGLTLLMCMEIITASKQSTFDSLGIFLKAASVWQKKSMEISCSILDQLLKYRNPILRLNLLSLLQVVPKEKHKYDYLKLSSSFSEFFRSFLYILQGSSIDETTKMHMKTIFQGTIEQQTMMIQLEDIVTLEMFLYESLSINETEKELVATIRSLIETSAQLQDKIKDCLSELIVEDDTEIRFLYELFHYYNPILLPNIDKVAYLCKIFNQHQPRNCNFYIKWFEYILCDIHYVETEHEWSTFRLLTKEWSDKIVQDHMLFSQMTKELDKLLERLNSIVECTSGDRRFIYFVRLMVHKYLKCGSLSLAIITVGSTIQNNAFIEEFEKIFKEEYFSPFIIQMKATPLRSNALMTLMALHQRQDIAELVERLLQTCCQDICFDHNELIESTLEKPSGNDFIYLVLFESSLSKMSIRQNLLRELSKLWNRFEKNGLEAIYIKFWQNFTLEQQFHFNKMWDAVKEFANKSYPIARLFNSQREEISSIIKLKENIVNCLDTYCLEAIDRQHYLELLESVLKQVDVGWVRGITFDSEVKVLEPFIPRLSLISKSNAWMHYYTAKYSRESERPHTADLKESVHEWEIESEQTYCRKSCLTILTDVTKLSDDFVAELNVLCTDWRRLPIEFFVKLFPAIESVESDLRILDELLQRDALPYLQLIFKFYKNQKYLREVYLGLTALVNAYNISVKPDLFRTFNDLLIINGQTHGSVSYDKYKRYIETIEKLYSRNVLNLCAEFYLSRDLIKFLNNLTASDADNLLEAVNDWDESLISTKSVMDFVKLKSFYTRIATFIQQTQSYSEIVTFEHVAQYLDEIFSDEDFINVLDLFSICSQSLIGIKHLNLELTNKQQSKRRCINEIMSNSSMNIIRRQDCTDRMFDVILSPHKLTFDDLSELRDRARLIEYSNMQKYYKQGKNYDKQQIGSFIEFVDTIEGVIKHFSFLCISGLPTIERILKCNNMTCQDGNYDDLRQLHAVLQNKLQQWEKDLCFMYQVYPELTYFCFDRFQAVEDFLYKNRADRKHPGYHFFKYIGFEPRFIDPNSLPVRPTDEKQVLHTLGNILKSQRNESDDLEALDADSVVHTVRLVETNDEGILHAAVSLFVMVDKPIHARQLFYCTRKTTWMEIRAFVYRCFFSKKYQVLIRPDLLPLLIQDQFLPLLMQLVDNNPIHPVRLGIITTKPGSHIQLINAMKTRFNVQILGHNALLEENAFTTKIQAMLDQCRIVMSHLSGLGKSTFIERESHRLKKPVIKFPISGNIKIDDVANRLQALYDRSLETSILHFDIGHVEDVHDLDELLYCLTLFRSFGFSHSSVCIPEETLIYVELASSPFAPLHECLTLCKHIEPIVLNEINWDEFRFNDPKVQFVARYLHALDTNAITKQNISSHYRAMTDHQTCATLIKSYFLRKKNPEFITWTQLSIFIAVLYSLFQGFSKCGYLLVENLDQPQLRSDLLRALLDSSDQFRSVSVEGIRTQQRASLNSCSETPCSQQRNVIVRWENTQPFTLVFTETYEPLFVYRTIYDVPDTLKTYFRNFEQIIRQTNGTLPNSINREADNEQFVDYNELSHPEFFRKLTQLSNKYFNKAVCIECFKEKPYNTQLCTDCNIHETMLQPKSLNDDDDIVAFQVEIATLIEFEYVLTADNYIKMLLVYMRVKSALPVLIMGETGCGKTALIKFLCQKILSDELEILRIHAGVNNDKILEAMNRFIVRAQQCSHEKKRVWIFFDEFNTTTSIDLLKEIICERTLLGEKLPDNMVFLGACNPHRQKYNDQWQSSENNIGIRKDRYETMQRLSESQHLLYTVVPIPETMLEYIWDYGFLSQETERSYIRTMMKTCPTLVSNEYWFNLFVQLVSKSQQFIRENEDVSSVSLRDVARYCRLYNWFHQSIINRTKEKCLSDIKIAKRAAFTALFLCYYFRINSAQLKNNYTNMLEENLVNSGTTTRLKKRNLIRELEREENELIKDMQLPRGMAKNQALRENIFVLLACIVNRIPVVLCGKPGCSKTSAVQIVISNLNGKRSNSTFFRMLPELVTVSYQGSQSCTSESVEKVFERASKYRKAQSEISFLPVIVFDEIGLAELSPHNPLKVLHAELEMETCQYGFVGISNWRLDASKMNRVLYVSCPDPDIEDLKITAKSIADDSLLENAAPTNLQPVLNALAETYYDLYQYLKTQQKNEHYFGLRDFYSLVKGVLNDAHEIMNNRTNEDLFAVVRRQLKINFDGIIDGSNYMWEVFCTKLNHNELIYEYQPPSFRDLLDRRIKARSGRFLMIIGESESSYDYLERYLCSNAKLFRPEKSSVRTLIGSQMPGDLILNKTYTETYSYKVLMDIILHVETNITLILRRLGHLHDNLYDLFNQNFAISAKKQYCRIALGALYHPRCLVDDNFFCIVFVNRNEVEKCDPPFLNRFEKHTIDIKDLVHPIQWQNTRALLDWLDTIAPYRETIKFPRIQHLFIGYSPDYIIHLVIETSEEVSQQQVIEICKTKILRCCSFDLPLVLATEAAHNDNQQLIEQYYRIHERNASSNSTMRGTPFNAMLNNANKRQIIYTYTQIYDKIAYDRRIVTEIKLNNCQTELDVINTVNAHFLGRDGPSILIIRIDYTTEYRQLLSLKYILLNALDDEAKEPSDRRVWLVIHLQRHTLEQVKNDVIFYGWQVDMINDLNSSNLISIETLMNPSYGNLISHEPFLLTEDLCDELINRTLSKFRYIVTNHELESRINQRRNNIIDCLARGIENVLRRLIQDRVLNLVRTIHLDRIDNRFSDWRKELLTNGFIIGTCRSLNDAYISMISEFYEAYFLLLFSHLEKHSFIDSYRFLQTQGQNESELFAMIWDRCFQSTLKDLDRNTVNYENVEISLVFDLRLPLAADEYSITKRISKVLLEQQIEKDDNNADSLKQQFWQMLNRKTVFGRKFINLIFDNNKMFEHYYRDHLCFILNENNIKLSTDFVWQLTSTNPTGSSRTRFQSLVMDSDQMIEIFRIFELGVSILGREERLMKTLKRQFIQNEDPSYLPAKHDAGLYTLRLSRQRFTQIGPKQTWSEAIENVDENRDLFIEYSLMNLLQTLQKPKYVRQAQSLTDFISTYDRIYHKIRRLKSYSVDNLEKFSLYISPIRSIVSLVENQMTKDIIQKIYNVETINYFDTCDSIHEFVEQLTNLCQANGDYVRVDRATIHRIFLKLEIELLKNWLIDNHNNYFEVLSLINRDDTELWRYSAKIFVYVDRRLQLQENIKNHQGRLAINEKRFGRLEVCLTELFERSSKVELLLVNHLHAKLVLSVRESDFETILETEYEAFETNVDKLIESFDDERHRVEMVGLIVWIKYYTQIYAFILCNDSHKSIMEQIDLILTRDHRPFTSTLKVFILKQLMYLSKSTTLADLREAFAHRHVAWLKSLLVRVEPNSVNRDFVLPLPLFEGYDEFLFVNKTLGDFSNIEKIRTLIRDCRTNQRLSYAFYSWFIQYYCHFPTLNASADQQIKQRFCTDLKDLLIESFDQIGLDLISSLCSNFAVNSYFHLQPHMPKKKIYRRLIVLSIVAMSLSTKNLQRRTVFGTIFFDRNQRMPKSYSDHIQSICLPGMINNDPIITQMVHVRTQVQNRLNRNAIHEGGKFIFQCSRDCYWMFYFDDCGVPNDHYKCPLCKKDAGAVGYGELIQRDPPQIRMNLQDGFRAIEDYITKYNSVPLQGYHNTVSAVFSTSDDKPDHIDRAISFRFLHMWTHAQLLFLQDLKYLTDDDLVRKFGLSSKLHFRQHFEKDCKLMAEISTAEEQYYIWLFKLINHMLDENINTDVILSTNMILMEAEQFIEQKLIFPHLESVSNDIGNYRVAYENFVQETNVNISLSSYVDELRQNEEQYPLLEYFNQSRIQTVDPLNEFRLKLQTLPFADTIYPMTTFMLKRLDEYANIRYLYPMMECSKYLIEKYNLRILRNDAATTTIQQALRRELLDWQNMQIILEEFIDAWYHITLKTVRLGCQTLDFTRLSSHEEFSTRTSLACILPNSSKDASSLQLVACIHTLASMQNEIVSYFQKTIVDNQTVSNTRVFLNAVKPEHLLQLDDTELRDKLIQDSFVINYEYGQGRDLIYDYEEIEMYLRNCVSSLCLFDLENMPMLTYQFELYNENNSLITNIRRRIHQKPLTMIDRTKLRNLLSCINPAEIVHCLGVLDNIFTYLGNIDGVDLSATNIEAFVEQHMNTSMCPIADIFRRPPFSEILLVHIISFYELIEELAFDIVLRRHIKTELLEAELDEKIKSKFIAQTFAKETISPSLKTPNVWIAVLKRLLIRILNSYVDLKVPLQFYIERIDLWSGDIVDLDLQTFEIDDDFLLVHTFCILNHIENYQPATATNSSLANNNYYYLAQSDRRGTKDDTFQLLNAKTWFSDMNQPVKKVILEKPHKQPNQKLRV